MAHYSEMDFLFSSTPNREAISQQLNNTSQDNTQHLFRSRNDNNINLNIDDNTELIINNNNIINNYNYDKKENTWTTKTTNNITSLSKIARIYYKGKDNYGTKGIKNYLLNGNNQRSGIYKNENKIRA